MKQIKVEILGARRDHDGVRYELEGSDGQDRFLIKAIDVKGVVNVVRVMREGSARVMRPSRVRSALERATKEAVKVSKSWRVGWGPL